MNRIAVFLPSLRGGGAERVGVTLANAFARFGHSVDLVLVACEGPYLKEVDPAIRIVNLEAHRVVRSIFKLTAYLRKERPEVLLSTFHHANITALVARKFSRVKTRVVVRTQNMLQLSVATSPRMLERVVGMIAPRAYLSADAIIAVSHGVADDLCRSEPRLRHKTQVVYNPVVSADLLEKARHSVEHRWLEDSRPVLLAVGRLHASKDYVTLLRAFAQVRRNRDSRLLILGEGDERRNLEALAKDLGVDQDTSFPGFVENPFSSMARAAVYVLSSTREGLPNSLVQAMALGTRIVATDCPSGPREILHGGKYGKLVRVGDVEGLAKAIEESLDGPIPAIPEVAIEPFRVDGVASKYLAIMMPGTC